GLPIDSATITLNEIGREFDNINTGTKPASESIQIREVTGIGSGYSADTYLNRLTWDGQADVGIVFGSALASCNFTHNQSAGERIWQGSALTNLVSSWVDGSKTNYGVYLANDFDTTWTKLDPGNPDSKYTIADENQMNEVEVMFSKSSAKLTVITAPIITTTIYNHDTRKLIINFNEDIDILSFPANLNKLSIEDGTNIVNLGGATVDTSQDSDTIELTLTNAQGNTLDTMKENVLRLVVASNSGILNVDGQAQLRSNTYSSSTYTVSNTAITGTLKDSKSTTVIDKATVKLYDLSGNFKGEAVSDNNGNFTIYANISSGNYNLLISKSPLFKDKIETVSLIAGSTQNIGTFLIDPYGIVYDALTGEPISGATVTLYTSGGILYTGCPEPNPQISRGDGSYNFNVERGSYYLTAKKDGYNDYTSVVFTVGNEAIEWNIPLVSRGVITSTYLSISKQANKKVVSGGDIITYTIDIKNLSSTLNATSLVIVDNLPNGFKYVPGSTRIDGEETIEPTGTQTLFWSLGTLNTQVNKKLTYRVRVSQEIKLGKHTNQATVSAVVGGSSTSAGPAVATVEVREGLFSNRGLIIGKVFEDKNSNGIQDEYEPGLGGVSLILDDGTVVVTDEFGRYSLPGVVEGNHVIRLDTRVLPGGPFFKIKDHNQTQERQSVKETLPRQSIVDRRPLDTWRKKVLSKELSNVSQERKIVPTTKEEKERPRVKKVQKKIKVVRAYSYTAKNNDGQPVIGILEAKSEAEVADILHKRGLSVISIEKEITEEVYQDTEVKRGEGEDITVPTQSSPEDSDVAILQDNFRGRYRSDIPKESKFFKIYGSETVRVNFPVKLLSDDEAKLEEEKDSLPNQFMLVGLADGTLGYLHTSGNITNLDSSVNSPYEDKIYEDGKVKFYLKGLIKGEYLLTGALDTSKQKDYHIFNYINPDKYYPVYGDNSTYFNETETKGKFYVRIDKDDSYGLWGNYNTGEFTKTELTNYNRILSGAKTHLELKDWAKDSNTSLPKMDFFYALSNQERASETFTGKGISGPYWLSRRPILEYSETIRVETRHRERYDIVLHTKRLQRDIDYEIDYYSGRIFFKEPISTYDENDDPNYVVIDYEFVPFSSDSKYYLTGSRLEGKLFDEKITIGGQFIGENHILNNSKLYGTDLVIQPDSSTRISGEWAYSHKYLDSDNSFLKDDNAWKVEGSKDFGKLKFLAYYTDIGSRFRNPINVTEKGLEKYGTTLDYQWDNYTNVVLDHWKNFSTISQTFDRQSSLDIYHQKEEYFLGGGFSYKEYEDKLNLSADRDINSFNLKAGRKLKENLVATVEQEYKKEEAGGVNDAMDNKSYLTTARLDYKLNDDTTIYFKERFIKELHNSYQNITGLGFSRLTSDGEAYVEYGFGGRTAQTNFGVRKEENITEKLTLSSYMNNCISGDKNEENIGFGTIYELREGLFTKFNFENTRTKNSTSPTYKHNSQSIAFDYIPKDTDNSYGIKFEHRKFWQDKELNLLGYAKHKLNEELNLIFNSNYFSQRSSENTLRTEKRLILGLAFRPIYNDKLNLLSKYEYKGELEHSTSGSSTDYHSNTFSWETNYEFNPKVELFGKYALRFQKEEDRGFQTYSLIDMFVTKITRKITNSLDFTSYYRIIHERDNRIIKQAPAVELGILFFKRMRLGVGFNFLDYSDRHHNDEGYSGIGPYFNLGAKF
ncbi:MAG: carboxypeptidase regulatory-like domain-containing protein, partial [Candidatus Omnitrophica bacterium]|nr:carboxypeptidase regulatory-like domain-containing protein [Candidatus Omnitrophota bacterium]